ncbi:MAG: glycoside hydrolase family 1 protein [Enterobacteriaceae bacterium]
MRYQFPVDFYWGSASSAPQAEGAAAREGKSQNIFDYWHQTEPHRFHQQVGPQESSTFYDNYINDIRLLKQLGHNSFRTSISWSRLIPDGTGEVNPQAVKFYNSLIDELLANDIEPFINLFHFDMPLCMQRLGGWENREVIEAYAAYARRCFELFGDRVKHWFTFNEPIVPVEAGYLGDLHYPCVNDFKRAVTVAWHTLLAHAKAVAAWRQSGHSGTVGIILNLSPVYPASDSAQDQQAARMADLLLNRSFLDPALKGEYPPELVDLLQQYQLMPAVEPGDCELLAQGRIDLLGVNYYHPRRVKAKEGSETLRSLSKPEDLYDYYEMPGRKMNPHRGWEIYEQGVYDILLNLRDNYDNIPCFISENGMGVADEERFIDASGQVQDDYRIDFIKGHLIWLHKALQQGCHCKGYHMWTFIDCWSWLNAYKNRYGFVRLELSNQHRTIKKSGEWFARMVQHNGFDDE